MELAVEIQSQLSRADTTMKDDVYEELMDKSARDLALLLSRKEGDGDAAVMLLRCVLTSKNLMRGVEAVQLVRMLLGGGGASPMTVCGASRGTALHWAVGSSGHFGLVTTLLEARADPNALDADGETPCMRWPDSRDRDEVVLRALVAAGGDVNLDTEHLRLHGRRVRLPMLMLALEKRRMSEVLALLRLVEMDGINLGVRVAHHLPAGVTAECALEMALRAEQEHRDDTNGGATLRLRAAYSAAKLRAGHQLDAIVGTAALGSDVADLVVSYVKCF